MTTGTPEQLATKWLASLRKGVDFDSWGQIVEACDEYSRLVRQIKQNLPLTNWNDEKKTAASKISTCLEIRIKFLKSANEFEEIHLADIKKLLPVMECLTRSETVIQQLPSAVDASVERLRQQQAASSPELTEIEGDDEDTDMPGKLGALLPKLKVDPGLSLVTVHINKIGLKNAPDYVDPVITVSCIDLQGVVKGPRQTTSMPMSRDDTYLTFDTDVELQIPLENMSKGTAVVFELYHYKQKKKGNSMRCYAFMEVDELKPGPCVIELYNKPYDNRRKKLTLFTKKALYLHLDLTIQKQH